MNCYYLGELPFDLARRVQTYAVEQLIQDDALPDSVFFCQHPPTISLGKRVGLNEVSTQLSDWRQRGIEVIQTDRGGEITFHGPGQLVVYPVINLRRHGLGVRKFVELMLNTVAKELALPGVAMDISQVGLWTKETSASVRKKLVSAGLRMQSGVTNHGFSINLSCETGIFEEFPVCGMPDAEVSTLSIEANKDLISIEGFSWRLAARIREEFCSSAQDDSRMIVGA